MTEIVKPNALSNGHDIGCAIFHIWILKIFLEQETHETARGTHKRALNAGYH